MTINGTKTIQKLPWNIVPGDYVILNEKICLVLDNSKTWHLGDCKYYDIDVVDDYGNISTTGISCKWTRPVLDLND